jgi:FkbM family methyltransferase
MNLSRIIGGISRFSRRVASFPEKSSREKRGSYMYRWRLLFPGIPAPVRLPAGVWWLADNDYLGECIRLEGGFEEAEHRFANRFLKPGMTVLDIGAHRGFHTLFFSKKVGREGRVLSFEPSPRSRKRLKLHLRLNFCRNVYVEGCALGETGSSSALYVVEENSVLDSLRPPDTSSSSVPTQVRVERLDDVLSRFATNRVDFIKLDVEGGELGVLKGAEQLLRRVPRPVILCEILEQRTRPWGYPARLIAEHLHAKDFSWFELSADGSVHLAKDSMGFNGNFVAVPRESLDLVKGLQTSRDVDPQLQTISRRSL